MMRRYEPKPWDIRRCDMIHADEGEYVLYCDARAEIKRLTKERDEARAQVAFNPTTVLAGATETPRAWLDVLGERVRQITVEGWAPEDDDCHLMAEMAQAAACYALSGTPADEALYIHGRWKDHRDLFWPFARDWWKPTDRRRDLVKAGALILAEIERLDRATDKECTPQ